jgi:hypothetical protein
LLSKLHLVDLAGCTAGVEAVFGAKPRPTPQDKSLLAWANVMSALAENQLNAMQRSGAKAKQVRRGRACETRSAPVSPFQMHLQASPCCEASFGAPNPQYVG